MDLLICRYWHRKVSYPRLYPERHKGFPNLFFACPIPMNTVQGKCIYLLSRRTQRDQAVCNTEHHREKKKPVFTVQSVPPWNPTSFATPCFPGGQKSTCTVSKTELKHIHHYCPGEACRVPSAYQSLVQVGFSYIIFARTHSHLSTCPWHTQLFSNCFLCCVPATFWMSQFLISYKPIKIMPFQFMCPGKVGYFKSGNL